MDNTRKQEIMRLTNTIIEYLLECNDEDFVDDVLTAISSADCFTDEDIDNCVY